MNAVFPVPSWCAAAVMAVLFAIPASARDVGLRFDMGTPDSPLKEGYVRATPGDVYTPSKGWGFRTRPARAFDRPKSRFNEEWYRKFWGPSITGREPYYGEPVDDLWRDGVSDAKDIVFRAKVPNGVYDVAVILGDEEWTRLDMNVAAEDSVVLRDVRTWIYWGAYPAHRRLVFRTAVRDGVLDLRFFTGGRDIPVILDTVETVHEVVNSVLAVEIDTHHPPSVSLAGGTLSCSLSDPPPGLARGFDLYKAGKYDEALEVWRSMRHPRADELKGILYGWIAGVVPRTDEIALLDSAVVHLERALLLAPKDRSVAQTLRRTVDFRDGLLIYRGVKTRTFPEPNAWCYPKRYAESGGDMLRWAAPDEPFHLKGRFEIAKKMYWNLRESGGTDRKGLDRPDEVRDVMNAVLAAWPDFDTAKIYLGMKVPWGKDYSSGAGNIPKWAVLAREVLDRQSEVVRWWTRKQAPDGSMGGDQSYGDDVEMLRDWPAIALATDDDAIRESIRRIADGVYTHIAPGGYNKGIWDVQHSAEPTADPSFLAFIDYGAPETVERGFQYMELFRDLFTGVNPNGHRHYKSILMGADGVTETPPFACDTHYHVRATKPGLWAAWYSGLPSAMKLLTEWADAWHADAMRTDRGKPKGVMPSAVAYADDRIGGYGPENDWRLTQSGYDYYDWNPGLTQLYDFMYAMWRMTGKVDYLDPMFLAPMPSTAVTWRSYTGDRSHDDIIRDAGGPYGRFLATGDITVVEKALARTLDHLRYNFPLMTSEVTMTDRIQIGDTATIQGMYLGGIPASGLPGTLGSITWTGLGSDFAALVREHTPKGMHLSIVGFHEAPRTAGIRFWDLDRGEYEFRYGPDIDDDGRVDGVPAVIPFTASKRGDGVTFILEPGKPLAVEVAQVSSLPPVDGPLSDIAFTIRDVAFARNDPTPGHGVALSVMVHNIGGRDTGPFTVTLSEIVNGNRRVIDTVIFPGLDAPLDFKPRTEPVALAGFVSANADAIVISADPENRVDEIYEGNNEVVVKMRK